MASEGAGCLHTVHCSLKKCFHVLQEQHKAWKRALAACTPLLSSLANLAGQMQASQKVPFANTPLKDFPGLPERLRCKQRCAVEALLEELQQDQLTELQKVRDIAGAHVASVFLLCEQQADGLSLEAFFQRSALCPSLADMLEWLLDVEECYHRVYLGVKLLFLQVSCENMMEMQGLPKAWEQVLQQGVQNTVEEVLLKVSFFLEAV
ncbi:AFG2-interacting ribosome maturation factor isoform X2 [Rhineura floridana]|uniref:AFG2-interacting ribosome maturation factor isoform X2 n=1 Tax=Rhineura floridana TaxID=261503 RepID=UPI002AC86A85|nr:AFG2-interacting ribosome maturation factor isoform X2 [Rhineura floridana]